MNVKEKKALQDLLQICFKKRTEADENLKQADIELSDYGKSWATRDAYNFVAGELIKILNTKK